MASNQDFIDYVCEQGDLAGRISTKKMFGEHALYVDDKLVALICDNQVFVKPTDEGRQLLGSVTEASPYPGAKAHFQVDEHLEDRKLFQELLLVTASAVPQPKPKVSKAAQPK